MNKPMQATGADALEKLRKAQEAIDPKAESEQGGDWRVRPKKVPPRQINIRIREDLYAALSELAFYSDESMSSIAGRAIEKEIRVMLREKGVKV